MIKRGSAGGVVSAASEPWPTSGEGVVLGDVRSNFSVQAVAGDLGETVRLQDAPLAFPGTESTVVSLEHNVSWPETSHDSTLGRVLHALTDSDGYEVGLDRLGVELAKLVQAKKQRFFYEEILKRSPEGYDAAMADVNSPSDAIRGFLCSEEFVVRHNKLFLDEFAHLKRELIVHVPKSGGTTLLNGYQRHSSYASLADEHYVLANCADRLDYYRGRAEDMRRPEVKSVVITGHVRAPFILENGLKRGCDEVYSILRNPVESAVSFVNYIITELMSGSGHAENASRRGILGLSPDEPIEGREMMLRLSAAIVDKLMPSQNLCSMFSRYDKFDDAAQTIAVLDVRFIPIERLDDFMTLKGLPFTRRDNVSKSFFKFCDIDRDTQMLIFEKIGEDLKLYNWLTRHADTELRPYFQVG